MRVQTALRAEFVRSLMEHGKSICLLAADGALKCSPVGNAESANSLHSEKFVNILVVEEAWIAEVDLREWRCQAMRSGWAADWWEAGDGDVRAGLLEVERLVGDEVEHFEHCSAAPDGVFVGRIGSVRAFLIQQL